MRHHVIRFYLKEIPKSNNFAACVQRITHRVNHPQNKQNENLLLVLVNKYIFNSALLAVCEPQLIYLLTCVQEVI